MEERSGSLVYLPNRAPLSGAHLLSHAQKGPRSSSCFLFPPAALSSRDHRNPAASVRIAAEEEDPEARKDGGGGREEATRSQRHARFVRWGAILRSNRGHKLFLAREKRDQGVLERNSWRRRMGPRSLSPLEISSESNRWNRSRVFGVEPIPEPRSEKIKGRIDVSKGVPHPCSSTTIRYISRVNEFFERKYITYSRWEKGFYRVYDKKWGKYLLYEYEFIYLWEGVWRALFVLEGRKETEKE